MPFHSPAGVQWISFLNRRITTRYIDRIVAQVEIDKRRYDSRNIQPSFPGAAAARNHSNYACRLMDLEIRNGCMRQVLVPARPVCSFVSGPKHSHVTTD